MGDEANCTATFGKASSRGKALLETSDLLFRGDFRVKVTFAEIERLKVVAGRLSITFPGGTLVLELGDRAAKWEKKIRAPKGLIEKLGIKPDARVAVLAISDEDFRTKVRDQAKKTVFRRPSQVVDILVWGVTKKSELAKIDAMRALLAEGGALWIVYPKGLADPKEGDVLAAGRASGMVDTKVASFSTTHTALRFSPRKA
jgi:hypothetical protein